MYLNVEVTMFRFLRSEPKEKTVRISVETIVKCLKLLRLRGDFDLVLNESTVNTLIRELNDFDPDDLGSGGSEVIAFGGVKSHCV